MSDKKDIVELKEDVSASRLYSEDLKPVPAAWRTWNTWHLAALWIAMAVTIPTYLLASYMIVEGLSWVEALIIIVVANLIITIPMVLNGHAGVKYGIPFPVLGRACFGIHGVHIASLSRALVACGWFGVQTWIGGLAIYAIFIALTGYDYTPGISPGKFIGFAIFWFINIYFVWKGTESIKWLEQLSAPILLLMGVFLIWWGAQEAGGFDVVLDQSHQLEEPSASLTNDEDQLLLTINPLTDKTGEQLKADEYRVTVVTESDNLVGDWKPITGQNPINITDDYASVEDVREGNKEVTLMFRRNLEGDILQSSVVFPEFTDSEEGVAHRIWLYLLWLTAMLGYWATMSLSIADITRFGKSQKSQIAGQFLGLPATMMLYSFVGIFVTCAAIIHFEDILIAQDAPWDPVSLISKFESPLTVVVAQFFMIIATLSTNIAANVIAPANAFSNLFPKKVNFRTGGIITGIIGILIMPWWMMETIDSALVFVSGLLGPILGIMIADYIVINKTNYNLPDFYKEDGIYAFGGSGFNPAAVYAFIGGVILTLLGYWVPALSFLYSLSWFTGFTFAFLIYYVMMKYKIETGAQDAQPLS